MLRLRFWDWNAKSVLAGLSPGMQQTTSLMFTERVLSCHTRNRFILTNLACPSCRLRGGMELHYGTLHIHIWSGWVFSKSSPIRIWIAESGWNATRKPDHVQHCCAWMDKILDILNTDSCYLKQDQERVFLWCSRIRFGFRFSFCRN